MCDTDLLVTQLSGGTGAMVTSFGRLLKTGQPHFIQLLNRPSVNIKL